MLAGAGILLALGQQAEAITSLVRVPRHGANLAMRDMDANGGLDLVAVLEPRFGVRLVDAEGRYAAEPEAWLAFPSDHFAWDLADLDSDGRTEVVCLLDGKEVRSFELDAERAFGPGEVQVEILSYLPRGVTRMDFVRDVDRDGREDLVVPGAGQYHIFLRQEAGGWSAPLEVAFDASIDYEVGDRESLTGTFGQRVRIPWFRIEDVDGDGRPDLVSETNDDVLVHLADPELSTHPTWVIDLQELRDQRPKREGLNLDDLFSNFDGGIGWRVADLDGEYPDDLVIQVGTTFKTYMGASRTGPVASPDQVLKVSGNLLYFFLRDVTDDGLPDLQLVRGERISLGRVIRWLIFPGSLDFELFTYDNSGGEFARRPSRRNMVSLEIPRLLAFVDEIDVLKDEIHRQEAIPARRFAWSAGGPQQDVVDLRDGALLLFRGRAADRGRAETVYDFDGDVDVLLEQLVLRDLDTMGDGGTKTIDLGELRTWQFSPGAELRAGLSTAEPDERIPLGWNGDEMELVPIDLDGDGRDDFVVVGEEHGEAGSFFVVQLVVRR